MRIALVHRTSFPDHQGSVERYLQDFAGYLDREGHDVTLLVWALSFQMPTQGRVRIVDLASKGGRGRLAPRAAAWLLRNRQDLVHALSAAGTVAGLATGHPTVLTELGELDRALGRVHRVAWRASLRRASAVVCPSQDIGRAVEAASGGQPVIIPMGLGLPADPPVAPAPGGLVVHAGWPEWNATSLAEHETLGTAIELMRLERPDVVLSVPAAPPALAPGNGWIPPDALRTQPRRLVQWDDRWPPRDAHVVVVNGDWEAPRAALEVLAIGRPAVVARGSGAEALVDRQVGRAFTPGDAADLANAIQEAAELVEDPATPTRCEAVAGQHAWSVVGPRWTAIHDRVLERTLLATCREAARGPTSQS